MLPFLLLGAALLLSAATGYFSVLGFIANFGGSLLLVWVGVSLEIGKLVCVSYLYRYWRVTALPLRWLLAAIVACLVAVSSFGIFGFLTSSQSSQLAQAENTTASLQQEQARAASLQQRLHALEQQVANLPAESIRGRLRLNAAFEAQRLKLEEQLDASLNRTEQLASQHQQATQHGGALLLVSSLTGTSPQGALLALATLVTLVFDPLAIFLFICYNVAVTHPEVEWNIKVRREEAKQRLRALKQRAEAEQQFATALQQAIDSTPLPHVTPTTSATPGSTPC